MHLTAMTAIKTEAHALTFVTRFGTGNLESVDNCTRVQRNSFVSAIKAACEGTEEQTEDTRRSRSEGGGGKKGEGGGGALRGSVRRINSVTYCCTGQEHVKFS